jgi:UDP-2,3-diacylglucosamine pyrophosphatase LpxH
VQAYKHAKVEFFDEKSKYIFFSDCHRGDDSISDEFARNQNILLYALNYYYQNGYRYVEVGDGDELWEHPRFKHIRSAHTDIFTTMKKFFDESKLIMLYGNHNIYLKTKSYVVNNYYHFFDEYDEEVKDLFNGIIPYEALVLKYKPTHQKILTVHGHQGDLMNDQLWFLSMLLLRYFWRFLHVIGFQNPSSPARNMSKRHKIEKAYSKWIFKHKKMLICGHTHRPKFPKNDELPYFNTGCCIHTKGITGIEILKGQIMTVAWRIRADKNGTLMIERSIMRGPEPIEKYNFKSNAFSEFVEGVTKLL